MDCDPLAAGALGAEDEGAGVEAAPLEVLPLGLGVGEALGVWVTVTVVVG
jgi:hypothetical protein